MKLALNGALTIGTDDGANIEIRQHVGDDNIFIFGLKTPEVQAQRKSGYQPMRLLREPAARSRRCSTRSPPACSRPTSPDRYRGLVDSLLWGGDHYLLLADYDVVRRDAAARRRAVPPARRMGRAARSPTWPAWARSRRTARSASTRRKVWNVTPNP